MNQFDQQGRRSPVLPILSVLLVLSLLAGMVALVIYNGPNQEPAGADAYEARQSPPPTIRPLPSERPTHGQTPSASPPATVQPSQGGYQGGGNDTLPTPAPEANQPVAPNEFVQVAQQATDSVVGVSNKIRWLDNAGDIADVEQGTGSGVVVTQSGFIITNAHVVADANALTVVLKDGTEIDAELIGLDEFTDIAVLKVDYPDLTPIAIGNSDMVQAGDYAIAIGNPMGPELYGTLTMGIISAPKRILDIDMRRLELMQTDAAINPGNSGGALINIRGELIGINTMKYNMTYAGEVVERIGFAVPVNIAMSIAQELIEYGEIERPILGISTEELSEYRARYLGLPLGMLVREVYAGSPAEMGGLQKGDVIHTVDGQSIKKYEDLTSALYACQFGDTIHLTVYREGKDIELAIVLEFFAMPED